MVSLFWISAALSLLAPFIFWFEGLSLGLNFFVYTTMFVCALIFLLKKFNRVKNENALLIGVVVILLSSTFFIFYNRFFNRWNLIVIPFLELFMIQWVLSGKFSFNIMSILRCFEMLFIPLDYIHETGVSIKKALKIEKQQNGEGGKKSKKRFILPLIITILVVFIVAIILATADDDFARIFGKLLDKIIEFIKNIKIWRLILRLFIAWIIYFYLSSFFYTYCCVYEFKVKEKVEKPKGDLLTLKMVMGGLNILYLIFSIIQFKAILFPNAGVEYSKYAREGFFQLIGISLLNLILIIYSINKKHNEDASEVAIVKILNSLMVIFTFIILLSSATKMYFAVDTFGYTVHRMIVLSAILEEFVLIIPTSLFITNESINLSKCYFVSIFAIYLVMNFANFEYIVSANNVNRYYETGKLDVEYLERYTGTDAIKPLIRVVNEKNNKDVRYNSNRAELTRYLKYIHDKSVGNMDFREFNISKYLAKKRTESIMVDSKTDTRNNNRNSNSVFNDDSL